jgi:molecular chaperone DnaK
MVYQCAISAGEKANIEKELNTLKEAVKSKDKQEIKQSMDSLQQVSHKLAEEIYKTTASQQAAGQSAEQEAQSRDGQKNPEGNGRDRQEKESTAGDDVIDADFKAEDNKS